MANYKYLDNPNVERLTHIE